MPLPIFVISSIFLAFTYAKRLGKQALQKQGESLGAVSASHHKLSNALYLI